MDKNMINIDDLVRQRLSSGEEKEPTGAWLNMKDLLDQNMPINQPLGFNWKRIFGIAAVLLLLSIFTVGSYQAINAYRDHKDVLVASTEKSAANIPDTKTITNSEIYNQTKATFNTTENQTKSNIAATPTSVKTNVDDKHNSNNAIAITKESKTLNALNQQIITKNKDSKFAANTHTDLMQTEQQMNKENNANDAAKSNYMKPQQLLTATSVNNKTISINNNQEKTILQPSESNAPKQSEEEKTTIIEKPVLSAVNEIVSKADNTSSINNTDLRKSELPKDSIEKMVIIQRSIIDQNNRTRRYVNDTVSVQKIAMDRDVLNHLSNKDNNTFTASNSSVGLKNNNINPAASSQSNTLADPLTSSVLVPLSNYKVHTRRTTKWNARSFDDVVRDVKFNLSQIRFYPGISFGGNSNFGANHLTGVQLGLFGMFTFGENWNAMAELKYLYHFNNGSVLEDDYMSIKTNASSQPIQSKVEHFFKFSSLQSIEMPIAIRYAAGRVNLFGGVNMTYNFRVNAEEVTLTPNDSSYKQVTNPNWDNSKPTVSYDDFKSRFSLGYLLGVGYQISPSLQIDMRMTKNVWDNVSGNGAQKVSNQYFKAPSIQFSLFYRFSQKNKIIK